MTPISEDLMRAVWSGDVELVRALVEAGADVNATDEHGSGTLLNFDPATTAYLLSKGADPNTHLKLGRGGLADIEWTVQLLQMRHAGTEPGLRTPRTLDALRAAGEAGLLSAEDADVLVRSWRMVSRVRNAVTLVQGKGSDQLPRDPRTKTAMATVLGYPHGGSDEMVNDYLRTTRRARAGVERGCWG